MVCPSVPVRAPRFLPFLLVTLLVALLGLPACGGRDGRLEVAYVTNNVSPFWRIAEAGARHAAAEADCEVSVLKPPTGKPDEQKRILEDLLARGVAGIAVSPIDPQNQTGFLDQVAARTLLVTHDSDAPQSRRLCYIGVDNYQAGRLCGELIREALPQGGTVVLLVGGLDADNARRRRQGVIDVLLERPADPLRFDPQDAELKGARYTVLATFTDQTDPQKAKAAAQDALTRWQDLGCMVGLYEYEPPIILEAVKEAGRLGSVKMVAFDENEATMAGVEAGHIHATIVQDPYGYGRESVRLLAALAREPDAAKRAALLPKGGFLDIPARAIRTAEIAAFRQELQQKLGR